MTDIVQPASTGRKVIAGILDFFTASFVLGYTVAQLTGNLTNDGFKLEGLPAFVVFGLIIIYFVAGSKYLGGTIWQRILYRR